MIAPLGIHLTVIGLRNPHRLTAAGEPVGMVATDAYTIEAPDGSTETVEIPDGLVETLAEAGEEPTTVVSDIVVQALAQHAHALVHHSEGETPDDLVEINDAMEDVFEDRFGMSLQDAMGHSH